MISALRTVCLALALSTPLVGAACQQQPVAVPSAIDVSPFVPPLAPEGTSPEPEAIDRARAVFLEAYAMVQLGQPEEAAARFLLQAEVLQADEGAPQWQAFAQNRVLAYRNAALAWAMAGKPADAHAALVSAAERDPLCREGIDELLAALSVELPPADEPSEAPTAVTEAELAASAASSAAPVEPPAVIVRQE